MKHNYLKTIALCIMALTLTWSCQKKEAEQPAGPDVQILVEGQLENTYNVPLGPEFRLENVLIPVDDDITFYWVLDGRKMLEGETTFSYTFEKEGEYTLEFIAYKSKYKDEFKTKLIVAESEELIVIGSFDESGYEIEDGDRLVINSIKTYPSNAQVTWTLDGKQIGDKHVLDYLGAIELGQHALTFKAIYGNDSKTIDTKVNVVPGLDYGTYKNILVGVLPETGDVNDVNWDNITHLYLPVSHIDADGSIIKTRQDQAIHEIVAKAREKKVQVLLSLNGKMNPVSGIGNIGETVMGEVLTDEVKRAKMISDAVTMVYGFKLNGIDLNYTEWQSDNLGALVGDAATLHDKVKEGITKFITEIDGQLSKTKLLTLTVPANSHSAGTDVQERHLYYDFNKIIDKIDWVNVLNWHKCNYTANGSNLAWMYSGWWQTNGSHCDTDQFIKWNQAGVPMNKLVLGFPLFGVRIERVEAYSDWGFLLITSCDFENFWTTYKTLDITPGLGYDILWNIESYFLNEWNNQMSSKNMPYFAEGTGPGTGYFWDPKMVVDGKLNYVLGLAGGFSIPSYNNAEPLKGAMLYGLDGDFDGDKSVVKYCYEKMSPRGN